VPARMEVLVRDACPLREGSPMEDNKAVVPDEVRTLAIGKYEPAALAVDARASLAICGNCSVRTEFLDLGVPS
jgi:hypothetical protein